MGKSVGIVLKAWNFDFNENSPMQNLRQDYSKNHWSNLHNFGSGSSYEANLETELIFLRRGQIRASRAQLEISCRGGTFLILISG